MSAMTFENKMFVKHFKKIWILCFAIFLNFFLVDTKFYNMFAIFIYVYVLKDFSFLLKL